MNFNEYSQIVTHNQHIVPINIDVLFPLSATPKESHETGKECNGTPNQQSDTSPLGADTINPNIELNLPFLCDLCGKRFEFLASMILHKNSHNNNTSKSKRKKRTKKSDVATEYIVYEVEENQTVPNPAENIEYSLSNSPLYIMQDDQQKEYAKWCTCSVCGQLFLRQIILINDNEVDCDNGGYRCDNCINSQYSQIIIL